MELFLGDLVHQSLEWLYHVAPNRKVTLDELITHFAENWKTNFSDGVRIRSGTAQEYFDKGAHFLANYFLTHQPFEENTLSIEEEVRFFLDDAETYAVRGFIDRLVEAPDGSIEVHDYKTSKRAKTQEQADTDQQLAFYHLGVQAKLGKPVKAKLIWHFLAENKQVVSSRTQEQLARLKLATIDKINRIKTNEYWPACGKPWCDWCAWKLANPSEARELLNDVFGSAPVYSGFGQKSLTSF